MVMPLGWSIQSRRLEGLAEFGRAVGQEAAQLRRPAFEHLVVQPQLSASPKMMSVSERDSPTGSMTGSV